MKFIKRGKLCLFLLLGVVMMTPCVLEGFFAHQQEQIKQGKPVTKLSPGKWRLPKFDRRWMPRVKKLQGRLSSYVAPLGSLEKTLDKITELNREALAFAEEENKINADIARMQAGFESQLRLTQPVPQLQQRWRQRFEQEFRRKFSARSRKLQARRSKFFQERNEFQQKFGHIYPYADKWINFVKSLYQILKTKDNFGAEHQFEIMQKWVEDCRLGVAEIPPTQETTMTWAVQAPMFPASMMPESTVTKEPTSWEAKIALLKKRLADAIYRGSSRGITLSQMLRYFQRWDEMDAKHEKESEQLQGWYDLAMSEELAKKRWYAGALTLWHSRKKRLGIIENRYRVKKVELQKKHEKEKDARELERGDLKKKYSEFFSLVEKWYEGEKKLREMLKENDLLGVERLFADLKDAVVAYEKKVAPSPQILMWEQIETILANEIRNQSAGKLTLAKAMELLEKWENEEREIADMKKNMASKLKELEDWKEQEIAFLQGKGRGLFSYKRVLGATVAEYVEKKKKLKKDYEEKKVALEKEKSKYQTVFTPLWRLIKMWYEDNKKLSKLIENKEHDKVDAMIRKWDAQLLRGPLGRQIQQQQFLFSQAPQQQPQQQMMAQPPAPFWQQEWAAPPAQRPVLAPQPQMVGEGMKLQILEKIQNRTPAVAVKRNTKQNVHTVRVRFAGEKLTLYLASQNRNIYHAKFAEMLVGKKNRRRTFVKERVGYSSPKAFFKNVAELYYYYDRWGVNDKNDDGETRAALEWADKFVSRQPGPKIAEIAAMGLLIMQIFRKDPKGRVKGQPWFQALLQKYVTPYR